MSNRHLHIIFIPGFLRHITMYLSTLELFSSLGLAFSQRFCPCMFPSWLLPPRICQQLSRLAFGIPPYMVLSLSYAKYATRIPDNLPCVRELQYSQTRRRVFYTQLPEVSRPQCLAIEDPFLLRPQWTYPSILFPRSPCAKGCAKQTFPVRQFPGVTQDLTRPTFASRNSTLGYVWNCSCSIMMTDKHSLNYAFHTSAPLLQIAQLTFSIYDQFSLYSRIALRSEESNWAGMRDMSFPLLSWSKTSLLPVFNIWLTDPRAFFTLATWKVMDLRCWPSSVQTSNFYLSFIATIGCCVKIIGSWTAGLCHRMVCQPIYKHNNFSSSWIDNQRLWQRHPSALLKLT